jgi:hypothetical protein
MLPFIGPLPVNSQILPIAQIQFKNFRAWRIAKLGSPARLFSRVFQNNVCDAAGSIGMRDVLVQIMWRSNGKLETRYLVSYNSKWVEFDKVSGEVSDKGFWGIEILEQFLGR